MSPEAESRLNSSMYRSQFYKGGQEGCNQEQRELG